MKLLYCRQCRDCVKLQLLVRHCRCAKSSGKLDRDMHTAETWGRYAEVIGVGDQHLLHALKSPDLEPTVFGVGPEIKTWLYPHNYERITRHEGNGGGETSGNT
jgi:hypothetical protein